MAGMYTLLNMLLLRAMKRLSFRIDELDCNLAPQCLHVAKPCLWCGFHFHPVPIKNVLVFLMSCKQLRNTWRTEQLFSETRMSRKHDRFACFPLFAMLDRRCIFQPLVKKSTLISNREIYVHYENCFEVTYLFCLILRDFKNSS